MLTYIHNVRSHLPIQPGEERYVFLNRRGRHLSRNYGLHVPERGS